MPLASIIGHGPVITLLRQAVARGRVPQTLLFAGPDGVGKNATAAALAQALNCPVRRAARGDDACGACPACQRIRDRVPAGQLTLSGPFFVEHREEILHLVRHTESKARAEHALERIIEVKEGADQTVVTLTGTHLTHGIGEALHHAYHGELDTHYTDEGDLLRVAWSR